MVGLVSNPAQRSRSRCRFTIHLLEVPSILTKVRGRFPFAILKRHDTPHPRGALWRASALCCRPRDSRGSKRMSSGPPDDRLDSWKEIAAYFGRGVRTVQRWESEEGLPVHRLTHDKGGHVYARPAELAAWWEIRRRTVAAPPPAQQPDRAQPRPPSL